MLASILALKEGIPDGMRWIPTHKRFSDGLTKYCATPRAPFFSWLQKTYAHLQE